MRPYVSWGRNQFRIGVKRRVLRGTSNEWVEDWSYRWVGVTWQ